MKVWSRLAMLFSIAPSPRVEKAVIKEQGSLRLNEVDMARRWVTARKGQPELAADIIRLGGLLTAQPMQDGQALPLDGIRLAYEAGRRDLAQQILAMMNMGIEDFNLMTERDDDY